MGPVPLRASAVKASYPQCRGAVDFQLSQGEANVSGLFLNDIISSMNPFIKAWPRPSLSPHCVRIVCPILSHPLVQAAVLIAVVLGVGWCSALFSTFCENNQGVFTKVLKGRALEAQESNRAVCVC